MVGLPLFDTVFAFCRRILSGKNPMKPDRGHFHHRLIDMGFSQKQAVAIAYAISGILGLAAVVIATNGEIRAIILLAALLVAGVIGAVVARGVGREQEGKKPPASEAPTPEGIPGETAEKASGEDREEHDEL